MKTPPFLLPLLAGLALAGCEHPPDDDDDQTDVEEEYAPRVFGDASYAHCSADEVAFNEEILRHARIAIASGAFADCIDEAFSVGTEFKGPYEACDSDPFAGASVSTQIDRAVQMARSPNDLRIHCSGGSGNASTSQNSGWGHDKDEGFKWAGWFEAVYDQLDEPLCGPGEEAPGCRTAPYPWPYSQAAGIVLHEAAHTHGYSHGANDQANALVACGYANDPDWHFQMNTAPYIMGNCVDRVLEESADTCGNIDSCPGDALLLVDTYGGGNCSCIDDPARDGVASVEVMQGEFDSTAHLATGTAYGGWNFNAANDEVLASGDFDGDGRGELLLMSPWGMGVIGRGANGVTMSKAMQPVEESIGGWWFSGDETIEAVGDFDSDGAEEFVIRSVWGIGIMKQAGNGFDLLWAAPYDSWIGSYYLRSGDEIVGTGRFRSSGREDLLVQGSDGTIGTLYYYDGRVFSDAVNRPGRWMGGWNHGSADTVHLPADYDADGRDEFLIRSAWGLAIIERQPGGQLTTLEIAAFGTYIWDLDLGAPGTGWTLNADDQLVAAGDMTTDGRAELVLRSDEGIGLVTLNASDQWRTRRRMIHGQAFPGGWLFGQDDELGHLGNFDGLHGNDLTIRSGWGRGVLSLGGTSFTLSAIAADPHASMLGTWYAEEGDVERGVVDFDGDGREELILVRTP